MSAAALLGAAVDRIVVLFVPVSELPEGAEGGTAAPTVDEDLAEEVVVLHDVRTASVDTASIMVERDDPMRRRLGGSRLGVRLDNVRLLVSASANLRRM